MRPKHKPSCVDLNRNVLSTFLHNSRQHIIPGVKLRQVSPFHRPCSVWWKEWWFATLWLPRRNLLSEIKYVMIDNLQDSQSAPLMLAKLRGIRVPSVRTGDYSFRGSPAKFERGRKPE